MDETFKILKGIKPNYEAFHRVKYSDAVLRAASELSAKFINDRHLPDKAIDVIDEAGARARIKAHSDAAVTITAKDIEAVIAHTAKVPPKSVSSNEMVQLQNLESSLKKIIFGQDRAIETAVEAIKRARAGFQESTKPVASLLFAGPTGVGKTELAKQLASELGILLHRFDMSEYQEKHTVARLIGAPPGYVGFDEGGLLTEAVRKNPHSVLLLDEIEKAHPDIFNTLLQVLDYATLTDNTGKKADFRNTIIIMTSNAGAREIGKALVGFGSESQGSNAVLAAVERLFAPEFRNRLDEIVTFAPLDMDMAKRVVIKNIALLNDMLKKKKILLTADDNAVMYLAQKGYSPAFGAREIARIIDQDVKKPLTDQVLFGALSKGGTALLSVRDGALNFTFSQKQ